MDERAASAPIAVIERMYGLELCVEQCGPNEGRKRVVRVGLTEIAEQGRDMLRRRRDEIGATRIVVIPSDPGLVYDRVSGDTVFIRGLWPARIPLSVPLKFLISTFLCSREEAATSF